MLLEINPRIPRNFYLSFEIEDLAQLVQQESAQTVGYINDAYPEVFYMEAVIRKLMLEVQQRLIQNIGQFDQQDVLAPSGIQEVDLEIDGNLISNHVFGPLQANHTYEETITMLKGKESFKRIWTIGGDPSGRKDLYLLETELEVPPYKLNTKSRFVPKNVEFERTETLDYTLPNSQIVSSAYQYSHKYSFKDSNPTKTQTDSNQGVNLSTWNYDLQPPNLSMLALERHLSQKKKRLIEQIWKKDQLHCTCTDFSTGGNVLYQMILDHDFNNRHPNRITGMTFIPGNLFDPRYSLKIEWRT